MANYSNLLATIAANIYQNNNNEVTADMVKGALNSMVTALGQGYQPMGVAVPAAAGTYPDAPDAKVCYIANTPGTYPDFNNLVVNDGEVVLFKWDTSWSRNVIGVSRFGTYPSISFARGAGIHYNYLVDSGTWNYKFNTAYDAGWVRIFKATGKVKISGAAPYRLTFYSAFDPTPANRISSISVPNIDPNGNNIPAGAVLMIINFRKVDNPNGYNLLEVTQPGAGATLSEVDEKIAAVAPAGATLQRVAGKNLINANDLLTGYRWSSNNGFEANANGILSNKLYLSPGKYTLQGVKAYATDVARILFFDDQDNFLNAGEQISLDANGVGVFTMKCNSTYFYAAYARVMLQYSTSNPFNPATAQLERGDQATAFEACVLETIPNPLYGHKQKTICLSGASIAMTANGWFEDACRRLGYKGYNVSISGESIIDAANKLWRGTLFNNFGAQVVDVLVLSHTHEHDVASTASTGILVETVAEYEAKGYDVDGNLLDHAPDPTDASEYLIAPGGSNTTERYAAAFDYVLKKWAEMCLAEKDEPTSPWYGTKTGKPCSVIICSYWHDGRETYNASAKTLAERHGALFCDFASQIGFSYRQTDPSDPNSVRQSALFCNNSAFGGSNDTTTEVIDGVSYTGMGWHPTRDMYGYLAKRRGQILAEQLKIATGWE